MWELFPLNLISCFHNTWHETTYEHACVHALLVFLVSSIAKFITYILSLRKSPGAILLSQNSSSSTQKESDENPVPPREDSGPTLPRSYKNLQLWKSPIYDKTIPRHTYTTRGRGTRGEISGSVLAQGDLWYTRWATSKRLQKLPEPWASFHGHPRVLSSVSQENVAEHWIEHLSKWTGNGDGKDFSAEWLYFVWAAVDWEGLFLLGALSKDPWETVFSEGKNINSIIS